MPNPSTKSSGIRMPVELYDWIDRRAATRGVTRSQHVCELARNARTGVTSKASIKQPWIVNAAIAGEYFSVGIILVGLQCMFGVL